MYMYRTRTLISALAVMFLTVAVFLPYAAGAQTESELNVAIRAALTSDPRTAELSGSQIDAMVVILAGEATRQGMTAQDITWRPAVAPVAQTVDGAEPIGCGAMPQFFCNLNHAVGFDGSDLAIPIGLGITSGLLILILGIMIERHYAHLRPRVPQQVQ